MNSRGSTKKPLSLKSRILLFLILPPAIGVVSVTIVSLFLVKHVEQKRLDEYAQSLAVNREDAVKRFLDPHVVLAREQVLAEEAYRSILYGAALVSAFLLAGIVYTNARFQRGLYADIERAFETVEQLGSSSGMLSATVTQYADVASEEAASIAEITSTTEELTASSTQIADHAKAVVDIAQKTWEDTKRGSTAVESVILKMSEIRSDSQRSTEEIVDLGRKSREISKVMEIINSIADQTKLLAFNAALEASSAGEAGKRFGVVAVEIRRLADSVTESTNEIENKISEIQHAVNNLAVASEKSDRGIEEGVDSSSQTASLLSDIVEAARSTMDSARQISLSTQQQKTANSQVATALREIMTGTSTTTAMVEAFDNVTRELTRSAQDLEHILTGIGYRKKEAASQSDSTDASR